MKQNQPIINGEIEAYKKDHHQHNLGQMSKQIFNNSSEEYEKINSINSQHKIYKGSPAKLSHNLHHPSNSISGAVQKSKQQTSKSFHSQNITPSQPSFSGQKIQQGGGDKNSLLFSAQKQLNSVTVNVFSDVKAQQSALQGVSKEVQSMTNIVSSNSFSSSNETFKVYARVRPINAKEKSQQNPKKRLEITKTYENTIYILDPELSRTQENQREKSFAFDTVFGEKDDNQKVYEGTIACLLKDHLLEGYNTTVFAYGQTGAGKTFTLFGDEYKNQDFIEGRDIMSSGIVTLIIKDLFIIFERQKDYKFSVKVSYLEIYNENIRDLLVDQDKQSNLMIVEDPQKGILIPELSEFQIEDSSELNNLIRKGNSIRVMASTQSNQFSSRSHCIIQINIEKTHVDIKHSSHKIVSKLSLIDLAGSERAAVSENKGIRMMEGSKINRSLLALGNCINILSDSKKQGAYIPYRDSKLTRLLKDSLGGTTKTVMIACIAPSYMTYEETINTLKYAQRAKFIQNKIKQNVVDLDFHASQYKEIIGNLKLEIESLKRQLHTQSRKEQKDAKQKSSDQINPDSSSANQKEIKNEEDADIEELSSQIFLNIEENWEITQTLRDLESLRSANQELLLKKQEEQRLLMKTTLSEQNNDEIFKLEQEIQMMMMNMQNNDTIFQELFANFEKNNSEKKILREKIRQIVESNENGQEKTLEDTCRLLQLEKMDLCSQNFEIKKEAQTLAIEKEKTVSKLKQMEREMELMKKQLQEKDKIITKSSLIINQLKQKEQLQTSKKITSSSITSNLLSPQVQPSTSNLNKKTREKSISSSHQDGKINFVTTQTNINVQEKSPIYSNQQQDVYSTNQQQDVYYKPFQQNRQLSSSRQEQQIKKKQQQQHSNNFSQTNLKYRYQNYVTETTPNNTNSGRIKNKFQQPISQNNGSALTFQSVKSPQNPENNTNEIGEEVKKEYYYFDSNKKLQKRSDINEQKISLLQNDKVKLQNDRIQNYNNNIPHLNDKNLQQNEKAPINHHQNSNKKESTSKQEDKQIIENKQQILDAKSSPNKQNKGLKLDLESLKKFDEIQKNKQEKKVQEIVSKNNNQQEVQVSQNKLKQKKKNKHKHNLVEEKITIDELKNYAQRLKDVDFQNVKIKPNLKKFQKNKDNFNQNQNLKEQDGNNEENASKYLHYQLQNNIPSAANSDQKLNNDLHQIQYQQNNVNIVSQQEQYNKLNSTHNGNGRQKEIQILTKENQENRQGQDYEKEFNNIQEKIVETQQLISSLKISNNQQIAQNEVADVVNQFQNNNKQIFEEYSNVEKLSAQKQAYYSKGGNKSNTKDKSSDFENYLQQVTIEQETNENDYEKNQQQGLSAINDISLMNKLVDNSIDQTLQDFIYNFEKAEHFLKQDNFDKVDNSPADFQLGLDQRQANMNSGNQPQSQKQQFQTTPDKNNKLNLKSLDEARVKMRQFKHLMNTLNERIKSSQVNGDMITQMKNVVKQYDSEQYTLTNADVNIIKEFKRILIIFKEYNSKNINSLNSQSSSKQPQNLISSANPSTIGHASPTNSNQMPSFNQINQYTTRPRSINSVNEETALHTQYYQSNNFNIHLNKRDTPNQIGHSSQVGHSNYIHYQTSQNNNISVNKKQIEQGAFSKIVNNYGEAVKVINSSQHQAQNNSSNLKKYGKNIAQPGDTQDSTRRTVKHTTNQESKSIKKYNSDQNKIITKLQNELSTNNQEGITSTLLAQISSQNENTKNSSDNLIKNNESNKNNLSSNLASSQIYQTNQNLNNNINSSTNRGKSVTSYVQINNKRKSFKEDSDKSYNNNIIYNNIDNKINNININNININNNLNTNNNKQEQGKQLSQNLLKQLEQESNLDSV